MSTPNFLIIGERRSGTTTLARWIQAHPEIYLHPQMDMAYFLDSELVGAKVWKEGAADYDQWDLEHSKEAYESKFPANSSHIAIGEKSADYLFWEPTHARIKKYYPNMKLVITVRNPIERAWSMYWNEFGKGRETLTFAEAIDKEDERVNASDYALTHLSYISRGHYAKSIKKLYKHFDKKNVHIIVLEHSILNPEKTLKELYTFLGVNPNLGFENVKKKFNKNWTLVQRDFVASNKLFSKIEESIFEVVNLLGKVFFRNNIYKRRKMISLLSRPFRKGKEDHKMSGEIRNKLRDHFAPLNQELEELIEVKLEWY